MTKRQAESMRASGRGARRAFSDAPAERLRMPRSSILCLAFAGGLALWSEMGRAAELATGIGGRALALQTRAPAQELFTERPSADLARRVEAQLESIKSDTSDRRIVRCQLAARLIQVDLLLGEEGSGRFSEVRIVPAEAERARAALLRTSLSRLNDLRRPESRKLVWEAIAGAHPSFRLYVEGVKLAGHDDDQRLLIEHLLILKAAWNGWAGRPARRGDWQIDDWAREILADGLRFQAIQTPKDAVTLTADLRISDNAEMLRDRPAGDPLGMTPSAAMVLRARGQFGTIDKAIHQAAALSRAGFEVSFVGLSLRRPIDASTDTIVREPLVIVAEKNGQPPVLVLGADSVLSPLAGERLAPGLWRFPSSERLARLLAARAEYEVSMRQVLESQASPLAWARACQEWAEGRAHNGPAASPVGFFQAIVGLAAPDPMASFTRAAYGSLASRPRSVFLQFLREEKIRLTIQLVGNGQTSQSKVFSPLDDRDPDFELPKQEAAIGRALQILPPHICKGLGSVILRAEPAEERAAMAEVKDGKAIVVVKESVIWGRAWADRLYFAGESAVQVAHEMAHRWGYDNAGRPLNASGWEGGIVDLFNEIAWKREGRTWAAREANFNVANYGRELAATNPEEDLAVTAERYVGAAPIFRHVVREQLKQGNLVPALKYLYFKHLAFRDDNGRTIEYEIAKTGQPYTEPFTLDEFQAAVKALLEPLTEEQQRLARLAQVIAEVAQAPAK
jgi:hypothetical protein